MLEEKRRKKAEQKRKERARMTQEQKESHIKKVQLSHQTIRGKDVRKKANSKLYEKKRD